MSGTLFLFIQQLCLTLYHCCWRPKADLLQCLQHRFTQMYTTPLHTNVIRCTVVMLSICVGGRPVHMDSTPIVLFAVSLTD